MKWLIFLFVCLALPKLMCCQDLVIVGVGDGNHTGSALKFVELYAKKTLDLNDYVIKIFSNGQETSSLTIDLGTVINPSDVAAGSRIFLRNGSDVSWNNLFNCEHDFSSTRTIVKKAFVSFNGNDAISLELKTGQRIDLFGRIGEVNSSSDYSVDWNYKDGWAYRMDKTLADGSFNVSHWVMKPNVFPTDISISNCTLGADKYPFAAYVLPLQFIAVSVSQSEKQPVLQWFILPVNEQIQSFEVQYSSHGFVFHSQLIEPFQEGVTQYSTFIHKNDKPSYYRVKVNTKDGSYFSDILRVRENAQPRSHLIYHHNQKVIEQKNSPQLVTLYDFSGQIFRKSNQKYIDVSFLKSGFYILKTKFETQTIAILN